MFSAPEVSPTVALAPAAITLPIPIYGVSLVGVHVIKVIPNEPLAAGILIYPEAQV